MCASGRRNLSPWVTVTVPTVAKRLGLCSEEPAGDQRRGRCGRPVTRRSTGPGELVLHFDEQPVFLAPAAPPCMGIRPSGLLIGDCHLHGWPCLPVSGRTENLRNAREGPPD